MTTIFRNLFKSKKGANSKKVEDVTDEFSHPSTSQSRYARRKRLATFADDGALSATAAYHTNHGTKLRKGPQSCPGGYQNEDHVEDDDHYAEIYPLSKKHRSDRRRHYPNLIAQISTPRNSHMHRDYHHSFRVETSDYGSGNPSLVGSSQHEETFDENMDPMASEKVYYHQKWKDSEKKRKEDRKKYREMEKEKEDMQKVLLNHINQLNSDKEKYRAKMRLLEQQVAEIQNLEMQRQRQMQLQLQQEQERQLQLQLQHAQHDDFQMPMSPESLNYCVSQPSPSQYAKLQSSMLEPESKRSTPTVMDYNGAVDDMSLDDPAEISMTSIIDISDVDLYEKPIEQEDATPPSRSRLLDDGSHVHFETHSSTSQESTSQDSGMILGDDVFSRSSLQ